MQKLKWIDMQLERRVRAVEMHLSKWILMKDEQMKIQNLICAFQLGNLPEKGTNDKPKRDFGPFQSDPIFIASHFRGFPFRRISF